MATLTRHKILFVDDEEEWRDMVTAALTEAGFEVLAASDASEALRQPADPALNLIIVDEDLAGVSGIILTRALRCTHPGVPTILYTSTKHDPDTTMDMMNQGADQCLPKGSMEELIANVGCSVR